MLEQFKRDYVIMKLTRQKLRQIIKEAMYNPLASVAPDADDYYGMDSLISNDDEMIRQQGDELVDVLGGSPDEVRSFKGQQKLSYYQNEWLEFGNKFKFSQPLLDLFDRLVDPKMNVQLFVQENENHPDYSDDTPYPDNETPRTHPERYYLYSINAGGFLKQEVMRFERGRGFFGASGPDDDANALEYILTIITARAKRIDDKITGNYVESLFMAWLIGERPNMKVNVVQ